MGEPEGFLVNLASSRAVVVVYTASVYRRIYRYIEMPGRCAHRDHSIIRARARVAARRRPSTPVRAQTWLAKQPSFFDRPRASFLPFGFRPPISTGLSVLRCVNLSRADVVLVGADTSINCRHWPVNNEKPIKVNKSACLTESKSVFHWWTKRRMDLVGMYCSPVMHSELLILKRAQVSGYSND